MNDTIQVTATWDEEARVWVAESEDVPGLVTEAGTLEQLISKLETMVPELLELNGISLGLQETVPLRILSERVISLVHGHPA
ncbi:MAG: DUF1902 domain-containing protein [Magnetococcales bacterium]|nr:DUF1902 domain-containing protein [Magnetococcales bacterium]MBF0115934.1 DUF1902 domain-containing protein [Magnetococcales bacterium]